MAFDYTTANTGTFYRGGRFVKACNALYSRFAALDAELKNIADPFEAADLTGQISRLYAYYDSLKNAVALQRSALSAYWNNIFDDYPTSLSQLALTRFSAKTFLPALYKQMLTDGKTVNRSAVSIGAKTVTGTGTGTAITTTQLDGVKAPVKGGIVIPSYGAAATASELALNETMTLTCIRDRYNGARAGSEVFSWNGAADNGPWGASEGSGAGPNVTCLGNITFPANGDFESWTVANTPDNWTLGTGAVAGTTIFKESTNFFRGASALKITGNGNATITLTQAINQRQLTPLRNYILTFRVKCSANAPAAGTLNVGVLGTGFSIQGYSLGHASFTTAWQLLAAPILIPASYPTDLAFEIQTTGTLTTGVSLYIDNLTMSPADYHGGIGLALPAGQTDWLVGDKITFANTNDQAGVFQENFRRQYGVQLPSSGAPNISDALAT